MIINMIYLVPNHGYNYMMSLESINYLDMAPVIIPFKPLYITQAIGYHGGSYSTIRTYGP